MEPGQNTDTFVNDRARIDELWPLALRTVTLSYDQFPAIHTMKICVLVLTYRRNDQLLTVLSQVNELRMSYSGANSYSVWVADSDPINPDTAIIEDKCDRRIVNPSVGFDGNILNYFKSHSHEFDFTLTISDDDLFSSSQLNPFRVLDLALELALESEKGIILFNHYDCSVSDSAKMSIIGKHYVDSGLALGGSYLSKYFLQLLPQHVGIMYSKMSIQRCLIELERFQGTQHLYAIPFLVEAIDENVLFFDYPLFLFSMDTTNGGAWENHVRVFSGLLKFLVELRTLVPKNEYQIAKDGFLNNYLGSDAWLRRDIEKQGLQLPTHEYVSELLAINGGVYSSWEADRHLREVPLVNEAQAPRANQSLPRRYVYFRFVQNFVFRSKCRLKSILKGFGDSS